MKNRLKKVKTYRLCMLAQQTCYFIRCNAHLFELKELQSLCSFVVTLCQINKCNKAANACNEALKAKTEKAYSKACNESCKLCHQQRRGPAATPVNQMHVV